MPAFTLWAEELTMSRKRIEDEELPTAIQLMRIVSIKQAAKLAGMSPRTMARVHSDKIIRMSPGRIGMRVRDALIIAGGKTEECQ